MHLLDSNNNKNLLHIKTNLDDKDETMNRMQSSVIYREIPLEEDITEVRKNEEKNDDILTPKMISPRNYFKAAFIAQILAIMIAGTGVVSDQLYDKFKLNIPTFQSAFNYVLLTLVFTPLWIRTLHKEKANIKEVLKTRAMRYFFLSLADVEANFLMVKAYSMTSITTIQVIDAFILPMTVLLSFLFLKHKYSLKQLTGVFSALVGCALIIIGDVQIKSSSDAGEHRLFGDALCLIASFLYALSNVCAEYFIKANSKREYLSMIGIFGMLISFFQMSVFETSDILKLFRHENLTAWLLFGLNSAFMFSIYTLLPCVLQISSAAFLNVNLLSADFYSIMFGIFIKKIKLSLLYFFGFGCIIIGTIVYSVRFSRSQVTASNQQQQTQQQNGGSKNKNEKQRPSIEMSYIRENLQTERF